LKILPVGYTEFYNNSSNLPLFFFLILQNLVINCVDYTNFIFRNFCTNLQWRLSTHLYAWQAHIDYESTMDKLFVNSFISSDMTGMSKRCLVTSHISKTYIFFAENPMCRADLCRFLGSCFSLRYCTLLIQQTSIVFSAVLHPLYNQTYTSTLFPRVMSSIILEHVHFS
jgi:hypothetical protein